MPDAPLACQTFEADLSALIDGELAPAREAEVRDHLSACDHCARRLEALCQVDLALAASPVRAVSPDFRARLDARIAADARVPGATRGAPRRPAPRRSRRALPAAGALLAAAAALALYLSLPGEEAPIAPAAPKPRIAGSEPTPTRPEGPTPEPESRLAHEAAPELANAAEAPAPEPPAPEPLALAPDAGEPLGSVSDAELDEIAVALDLDTFEDLDVIANLDLLERLLAAEEGAG